MFALYVLSRIDYCYFQTDKRPQSGTVGDQKYLVKNQLYDGYNFVLYHQKNNKFSSGKFGIVV